MPTAGAKNQFAGCHGAIANSREQIRFVNMNTIADEDHAVIIPEFDV